MILNSLDLWAEHQKDSEQLNNFERLQICLSGARTQRAVTLQGRRNTWEQKFDFLSEKEPKKDYAANSGYTTV